MARLLLFVLVLWAGIAAAMAVMAHMNNLPLEGPKILAESFYYAAIALAVYRLVTRNKRPRDEPAEEAPPPATDVSDIHAQSLPDQEPDGEPKS